MVVDVGYWKKVIKRILTLAITIVGIYLAFKMAVFYMPFLIAFIISLMVEPIIRKFAYKTKISRKACAIIVLFLVFAIIVGLLIWGIAILIDEGSNLLSSLNYYIDEGYEYIMNFIDKFNFDDFQLSSEVNDVLKNSTGKLLENVSKWISGFLTSMLSIISQIGTARDIYCYNYTCNIFYMC